MDMQGMDSEAIQILFYYYAVSILSPIVDKSTEVAYTDTDLSSTPCSI